MERRAAARWRVLCLAERAHRLLETLAPALAEERGAEEKEAEVEVEAEAAGVVEAAAAAEAEAAGMVETEAAAEAGAEAEAEGEGELVDDGWSGTRLVRLRRASP